MNQGIIAINGIITINGIIARVFQTAGTPTMMEPPGDGAHCGAKAAEYIPPGNSVKARPTY